MESSPATPTRTILIVYPAMKLHPSSSSASSSSQRRRCSASFSFSPSSFNVPDHHDDSPATTPFRFSGVPFSWEHVPGIPKKQSFSCSSSSLKVLPLPPTTAHHQAPKKKPLSISKHSTITSLKDPFVAALVECSKDEDDEEDQYSKNKGQADRFQWSAKVSRSVSNRFGFVNLYALSCKRSCEVSQSLVHVPRLSSRTSSSSDLLSHRSRSP